MSRGPFEMDPDEAPVRALIRRSDGPMVVRPFRAVPRQGPAVPWIAATAAALVVGLVIGTGLSTRRQDVASTPTPTAGIVAPSATPMQTPAATATPAASATPEPTPGASGAPVSAGPAPEAGVVYVLGSDDLVYRYDGATGTLTAMSGRSTFVRETTDGALVIERDGITRVLRWNGGAAEGDCAGPGTVLSVSRSGACAYRESDGSVTITGPGDPARRSLGSGIGEAVWDDAGSRLALIRSASGQTEEERAHSALWIRERDGTLRKVYEPKSATAFVVAPRWSPDGRSVVVFEAPYPSSSIVRDGIGMLLLEVDTGSVAGLGTTLRPEWVSWSSTGELAFVRGAGRETWMNKRLIVRSPDGSEREIALPAADHVQLVPAWSSSGDLAFVVGPSKEGSAEGYMEGTGPGDRRGMVLRGDGSTREVRCPNGAVEGIRPSADGTSLLLLCRTPGDGDYPLSIWFAPQAGDPVRLVRRLGEPAGPRPEGGLGAGGFGYYGLHPHLETITAWSRAVR